jgi:hypothetical protein
LPFGFNRRLLVFHAPQSPFRDISLAKRRMSMS